MLGYGTGNQNIPASSAAAGGALSSAGTGGVQSAIDALKGYSPTGGVGADVAGGNQFVGGMDIPALVKAQMLPATQEASEQTLPSIARAAAAGGNTNSSRTAIAQGIVQRGLGQQAEADAAQLQQYGLTQGSNLTEQSNEANNNNRVGALSALLSGSTGAANAGTSANTGAVGNAGGLFSIANAGITGQQAAAQAPLTNEEQQFEAQTNDPFAALNNFYNIIGANNWGGSSSGTGTQTTTSTPSPFQVIGGLLGAGGAFLHSDARMKTDIQDVGVLDNGLTVYRYRYKDDPTHTFHIGLLAQEVERDNPEAVKRDDKGRLMVNYYLATQDL
jgi:hypothetical protein